MNEAERKNPEIFNEHVSDTLHQIYTELNEMWITTPESLNSEITDRICTKLNELAEWAEEIKDEAKQEILKKLELKFYCLHTIGTVDDRKKFETESIHAFELLEMALLAMDGAVRKNQGKVLASIKAGRERDTKI